MEGTVIPQFEINIGQLKVMQISGTSSLVVGTAEYKAPASQSKTTNGVGSAYGDGSNIHMRPYQSPVNDSDVAEKMVSHTGPVSRPLFYYPYYPAVPGPYYAYHQPIR
ncbi:spore germination protein [Bacillus thermotolerans]|uniref:Uncharacterized protein n=1 Tax=Bacillus thermotolerans TaxID=1221996 RepID=A0A0F5I8W5_BACTR|nr:spore germination protein [Bacillus thermotolerans]KKB34245.1 hypothetical protein QY97_02569 [Bacillus thermotolerans]KKB41740.1 hypothetical protein QY95_00547 [Bacillus thermotolerans]KKB44368.1 hypothetical protein QY96_02968 [Bacillus thermotolerans]